MPEAACSIGHIKFCRVIGIYLEVCLAAAKKEPKYAKAQFATQEQSNIQASAGDADIRVNIPFELNGNKGLYQCIAAKQADGTYKVTF